MERVHSQLNHMLFTEEANAGNAAGSGLKNRRRVLARDAAERNERKWLKGIHCFDKFFEADGWPINLFGGRLEDGAEDCEVCAAVARGVSLVKGMCRNAD